MAEIARETFTVTTTGVGRPDYSPRVETTKLVTDVHQQAVYSNYNVSIPAESSISFDMVRVSAGYKLNLGTVICTCNASCIQRLYIYQMNLDGTGSSDIVLRFHYDMIGIVTFGPEDVVEIVGPKRFCVMNWNYDKVAHNFGWSVQGFLQKVS